MSEISKQIKRWAKTHEWLVNLAADIDRLESLANAEADAEVRLAKVNAAVSEAQKKADAADKYVENAKADADRIIAEATDRRVAVEYEIKTIVDQANRQSVSILATANAHAADITEAAQRNKSEAGDRANAINIEIDAAKKSLADVRAEYDAVVAAIADARAKAAEAMRAISG